jgi:hypothetical protein
MKYIITESRYNDIVTNYLDTKVYPDYGWASTEAYIDEMNTFGYIDFYINDIRVYSYYDRYSQQGTVHQQMDVKFLIILPSLNKELTDFFGLRWKPIFKEWFETNSGLNVKDIIIGK